MASSQANQVAHSLLTQIRKDAERAAKNGTRTLIYSDLYKAAVPIPPKHADVMQEQQYFVQEIKRIRYVWSHFSKIRNALGIHGNPYRRVTTQQVKRFINFNEEFADNTDFIAMQEEHRQYAQILAQLVPKAENLENHQKELYHLVFIFQDKSTELLGRTIEINLVWRGDESTNNQLAVIVLNHDNINDFLRLNWQQGANLRFANDSEMGYILKQLKEQQKTLPQVNILNNNIQMLYREIQHRQACAVKRHSPYLMWQKNNEWVKIKFGKWGYIFEALVNMSINGDTKELTGMFQGSIENVIDYFVTHFLTQVDNAAGFISEDVEIGDTGQFIGVKSTQASLMALTNIVNFAKEVIKAYTGGEIDEAVVRMIEQAWGGTGHFYKIEDITAVQIDEISERIIRSITQPK